MKKKKIKDPKWSSGVRRDYIWHRPGRGVLETRIEQIEEATGLSRDAFMEESRDFFMREKDLVAYMAEVDPKNPFRRAKSLAFYEYGMRDMIRTILSMSRRIKSLEKEIEKQGRGQEGGGERVACKGAAGPVQIAHVVQGRYHEIGTAFVGLKAGEKFSALEHAARRAAQRIIRSRDRIARAGAVRDRKIEVDRAGAIPEGA